MKRWAIRIAVFLLLGVIINVAVAWGIWILPMPSGGSFRVLTPGPDEIAWWQANAPPGFVSDPADYVDHKLVGRSVAELQFDQAATASSPRIRQVAMRCRTGWPRLTFEGAVWTDIFVRKNDRRKMYYPPEGWPCRSRGIPYVPIWPGFVINTLFYATILWTLFASFALRGWRRVKRGLCPKCAYPVGESPVCTECGMAVTRRT